MKKRIALLAVLTLLTACGKMTAKEASHSADTVSATAGTTVAGQQTPAPSMTANATPSPSAAADIADAKPKYFISPAYIVKPVAENDDNKVVLLTFDDAPKDQATVGGLLDILDKHHAKAIFFVNGYRVKQNPDLLKEIAERGQTIGNHSWDHIDLAKEQKEKVTRQISDVQAIVKDLTGQAPVFFRPPFGSGKGFVKEVCKENNLVFMTWSNGSLDWADNQHKPDGVIKSVLEQLHPGSNILMHELPWTVEALDELLTKLKEKGYSFVDPQQIDTNHSAAE